MGFSKRDSPATILEKNSLPQGGLVASFLIRLVIGALFALFGAINYFGHVDVNPVTGEKQRIQLSPRQEVVLGLQAREQMAVQHGGLYPDQTLQRYIDQVGERVVKGSEASKSPYPFEFHLLRDPRTVNAFALPGGQVFITAALLGQLQSEAQLAGVLGHEAAHVVARHGAEHMAKQQLGAAVINGIGVATSDGSGGPNAAVLAQAVQQLASLRYGRADELESDELGFKFMVEAGYDPRGIAELMKILAATRGAGGAPPEILSSHPDPGNRFERLKELIQANFPQGIPRQLEDGRDRFAQVVAPRLR